MNSDTLNAERTIHWLNKTIKTINNMPQVGSMENGKALTLAGRYNELRERAIELGVWNKYCDETGSAPSHDGYDLFA